MEYVSTRGKAKALNGAGAILKGLASDGGLFVPQNIPKIDIKSLKGKKYDEIAGEILQIFLPEYDVDFLHGAITAAYGAPFAGKAGHLEKLAAGLYALELWHGPTAAFKDYALQLMPRLLVEARHMLAERGRTLILVATSGDTGSAALAGYAGLEDIEIAAFYPENGVSLLQKLQMTTREGVNVAAFGVRGNFDDCQRGVKRAFTNAALAEKLAERNVRLSSANSINWGRLLPQLVYYVSSYLALWERGEINYGDPVDYCVPTGNFGDIMAGWYAREAGLPVGRLLCASNRNRVLADFLETGRYNAKREFYKTSSPSMDILVSSNLERLLYHASGSAEAVRGWMERLAAEGSYTVPESMLSQIRGVFGAGWAAEEQVFAEVNALYHEHGYLADPHTAVAFHVARGLPRSTPCVVLSTASPFKFSREVLGALGQPVPEDEFEALRALEAFSGQKAPGSLAGLAEKPVRFKEVVPPESIEDVPLRLV